MPKTILPFIIVLVLTLTTKLQAQVAVTNMAVTPNNLFSDLTRTTWKIHQLYVDSVLVDSPEPEYNLAPSLDSLRYTYSTNYAYSLSNLVHTAAGTWAFNPSQTQVIVKDDAAVVIETLTIIYLDASNFIYTVQSVDLDTGKVHILEYRLVPI